MSATISPFLPANINVLPADATFPLINLAVTPSALFVSDWNGNGSWSEYCDHHRKNRNVPMAPGPAMPIFSGLLHLNRFAQESRLPLVYGHIIADEPDVMQERVMHSLAALNLGVLLESAIQTYHTIPSNGNGLKNLLHECGAHLFLSGKSHLVRFAIEGKFSAGYIRPWHPDHAEVPAEQRLRLMPEDKKPLVIATDYDAVLSDDSSEAYTHRNNFEVARAREYERSNSPHNPGPMLSFWKQLMVLRNVFSKDPTHSPLQLALATARGLGNSIRAVNTLRSHALEFDHTVWSAGKPKTPHLLRWNAAFFADDHLDNVVNARNAGIPSAHVPYGTNADPNNAKAVRTVLKATNNDLREAADWLGVRVAHLKDFCEHQKIDISRTPPPTTS